MGRVRWLHFSDLHLGNDKATETRLMRRELPEYIAGLNRNFDYAFCTGDKSGMAAIQIPVWSI